MAPILRPRTSLTADKFPGYFEKLRSQKYDDEPNSRKEKSPYHIRTIAWNPIGTLVATGSMDKSLRVWNPEKPYVKFSTELKGHQASVEKIAWNPTKDAELCSVSSDGAVKFWDVRTKTCFNEVKGLEDAFTLVWAPDGQTLIVGNKSDKLFILSPTSSTPLSTHQQTHQTNQIAFDPSGNMIFVTTNQGKCRILSYPGFEPLLRCPSPGADGQQEEFMLSGHTSACVSVELQPTGRHLATGGADSVIALWDTGEWLCKRTVSGLAGLVRVISFTFDGSYVVGGSDDGTGLEATHVESGQVVHTFKTSSASPVVAWAPTRYCLAYTDKGILRIIGLDTDRNK